MTNTEIDYSSFVADAFPDPIAILSTTGIIMWCNKATYEVSQLPPSEIIGKRFTKLAELRVRDIPRFVKMFASILRGKSVEPFELTWNMRDGTILRSEARISLISTFEGQRAIQLITRDVSEIRKVEEQLKDSEKRLADFFQNAQVPLFRTEIETGLILDCNKMGAILFGYRYPKELIGRVKTTDHYVDSEARDKLVAELSRSGKVQNYQLHMKKVNGEISWVEVSATSYPDEGYIESVVVDITNRKVAEDKLQQSEARFRSIFEQAAVGVARTDKDGLIIDANEKLEKMLGYGDNELLGVSVFDITTTEDKDLERQLSEELLAGKRESYSMEKHFFCKDGHQILGRLTVSLSKDSKGEVDFTIGVLEDITEYKRIQEALRTSEVRYRSIVGSAGVGINIADTEDHILEANEKFQELVGYSLDELKQMKISEFSHLDDANMDAMLFGEIQEGKRDSYQMKKRFIRKDGTTIWTNLTVSVVRNQKGRIELVVGITEDITEQKSNELIRTQQEREIDLYGSLLRHDLRNDLGLILSYIEAVQMMLQSPGEKVLSFLDSAIASAERMADLLKSFGRPQDVREIDIVEFIKEIADEAQEAEKDLRINVYYEEEIPTVRITAGSLLALVFMNLFRNAEQHAGDEPQIEVRVSEDEKQLNIIVSDDGPGVPEKFQDRLFLRGTSSKGEGGGLGLYLSREILERTGGSIELLKDTKGAAFHITIPTNK